MQDAAYSKSMKCFCNGASSNTIKVLLDNGLDVNVEFMTNEKISCDLLEIAAQRGDMEMMKMLDKRGFNFKNHRMHVFLHLCRNGSKQFLQIVCSKCESKMAQQYTMTDNHGSNGLHLAVVSQSLSTVEYLLKNVYFCDNNKNNPDGLKMINQANKYGETPAVMACKQHGYNSVQIFQLLVKYGCRFTPTAPNNWFPLYAATYSNNISILRYMLDNKLGLNTINMSGHPTFHSTPIMVAIAMSSAQAVQLLCEVKEVDILNIKSKFKDNYTALEHCAYFGNVQIIKIVLKQLMQRSNVKDCDSFSKCLSKDMLQHLHNIEKSQHCTMIFDTLIKYYHDYNALCLYLNYQIEKGIKDIKSVSNVTFTTDAFAKQSANFGTTNKKHSEQESKNIDSSVDRWEIHETLGNGAFGEVKKGVNKRNRNEVALKFVSLTSITSKKEKQVEMLRLIMNEIDICQQIDHKHVIKILAYNLNIDNKNTILLVFEYAPYGELYQFLAVNKYFNQMIAKTYFEQILNALQACHSLGIIHRDLKPQNILLNAQYQIKIADFGLSTYNTDIKNKRRLFVGTRGYMSPEIASPICDYDDDDNVVHNEINQLCDLFSLGVILWQMLNGIESIPFDEAIENDAKYMYIASGEIDLFWKCHYNCKIMSNKNDLSFKHVRDLLIKMFAFNCNSRIKTSDIMKHEWYVNIAGYNNDPHLLPFFQDTMKNTHFKLLQQQSKILSMLQTRFNQTTLNQMSLVDAVKKSKDFEISQLTYVFMLRMIGDPRLFDKLSDLLLFVLIFWVFSICELDKAHLHQ